MNISKFLIRASYPNYFMVKLYADCGRDIFEKQNEREGNKPGTVIYTLEGDDTKHEIAPRWYDIFYLLKNEHHKSKHFLSLLIREEQGDTSVREELERLRTTMYDRCKEYVDSHPLQNDIEIVTPTAEQEYSVFDISYKGRMLLELTQQCYSVPDFCILSSLSFHNPYWNSLVETAIENLEVMTFSKLGSDDNPLVFAIRTAMPQYIPGLMPTLLNIGVTQNAYKGLLKRYPESMANRIYLSTLQNIFDMLSLKEEHQSDNNTLPVNLQREKIERMESEIRQAQTGSQLLTDAMYQVKTFMNYVRDFYVENQDSILTFMQGKHAYPSFILHKMVWTVGNDESYPGVMHSRHSRTGRGTQIESYKNIFGEEIMTGYISSEDTEYFDRSEIKTKFPAVYHFDPLLTKLETRFKSPVTIEFAVETVPDRASLFAVLQLNMSELTGRSALLSSIAMYEKGIINKEDVVQLIRPYHLRQIISDSIDEKSLSKLTFFGKGLNVLPRTAITAVICFSAAKASEMKKQGYSVCLCQERFIPEDTITLNEVDAILSMTPAAIHVVTACRGYGIPAFLNLQSYGIRMEGNSLVNDTGLVIGEGDKITLSSKHQTIYIGEADFRPARFMKYLNGENVVLEGKEKPVFENLKTAYTKYQEIINSTQTNYIADIDTLARIIRCDLKENPEKAKEVVNSWYDENANRYIHQVLESKMGSHQDQSRVFDLLDMTKKIDFFRQVISNCIKQNLSGLSAGSFMLGRFVAKPLPCRFWSDFTPREVAYMLNEYILYEKYLQVLEEVGETKLTRAHSKIVSEGMHNFNINTFNLFNFATLIHVGIDWNAVEAECRKFDSVQENTLLLIQKLSRPAEEVFDLSQPWNRDRYNRMIQEL